MAIDALIRYLSVFYQCRLVEGGEVTLTESHLTVYLKAGGNATVCDTPFVKRLAAYENIKTAITRPTSVLLGTNG